MLNVPRSFLFKPGFKVLIPTGIDQKTRNEKLETSENFFSSVSVFPHIDRTVEFIQNFSSDQMN